MRISVVGTGYVGLVSGVCLAELGHEVICVDIDEKKVDRINNGEAPIYEKGLTELLQKNVANKQLVAVTNLPEAVVNSDLTMIAVGTPFDGQHIDLSYVKQVSREIGSALSEKPDYHVVVVKSTVVPGTTDDVVAPILQESSGKALGEALGLGMNPEFLREGDAIVDFMYPDRIVYGANDDKAMAVIRGMYDVFPDVDKVETDNRTAEMIKYTANSLLATMISFSNEIGNLCAKAGVDVQKVMRGVHLDKRLSPILDDGTRIMPVFTTYIEAGCGFGGSCFPKDVKALVSYGEGLGTPMKLLADVVGINNRQPMEVIEILKQHFPNLSGLNVAVLGLAFKPESDDMRESPSIPIINSLAEQGAQISAYDPIAEHEAKEVFSDVAISYADTVENAVRGADAVIVVTRWKEFAQLDEVIERLGANPVVVDGRRMLNADAFERYAGIGYPMHN